ncbi:hypothetical protein P20429_2286 [Pseudoalteromonas sp. BSi20429]|nr:hypothetical protein P20429_2286 [Pseudoalteromonas sp. BSi20429]
MFNFLAIGHMAQIHPSLFVRTTTGLKRMDGSNTFSALA